MIDIVIVIADKCTSQQRQTQGKKTLIARVSNTFNVFNRKIRCGCELVYTQTTRFIPNWNRIFPLVLAYLIIFVCLYLIIINDFCLSQTINLLFPGNFFITATCYLNISFKYLSFVTLFNLNCRLAKIGIILSSYMSM